VAKDGDDAISDHSRGRGAAARIGIGGGRLRSGRPTNVYFETLSGEARARSDSYFEGGYWLLLWGAIAPVFISLLFNDYTPMEDGPTDSVYVFDQSRQHDRVSTNISGLFGTMRLSLNDNLLERWTREEVEAVMHERGHYVLNHVLLLVTVIALIFALGLFLMAKTAPRILARLGEKWGARGIEDPAAFPLFVAILTAYFLVIAPVRNALIRAVESQADAFGLDAARQPDGFASVAMKLSQHRKIEPSALEEFLFFDQAMDWKAENIDYPEMIEPNAEPEG